MSFDNQKGLHAQALFYMPGSSYVTLSRRNKRALRNWAKTNVPRTRFPFNFFLINGAIFRVHFVTWSVEDKKRSKKDGQLRSEPQKGPPQKERSFFFLFTLASIGFLIWILFKNNRSTQHVEESPWGKWWKGHLPTPSKKEEEEKKRSLTAPSPQRHGGRRPNQYSKSA